SPREARDPAVQALRPGCEELAVTDPAQMPVREARPRSPKPPRWSAERRASRVMGRKAPRKRLTRRVMACPTGAAAPERFSALRHPHSGVIGAKVAKARAQKRAAGPRRALCRLE